MTEAAPEKPVFIDQMPDYQKAMQGIQALSQDQKAFEAVAGQLGLGAELQQTKARLTELLPQGQAMAEAQGNLEARGNMEVASAIRKSAVAGLATGAIGGIGAGVGAARRWGTGKGILAGLAAAVVSTVVGIFAGAKLFGVSKKKIEGFKKEAIAIETKHGQLLATSEAVQQQFMERMAQKLLAERKELVFEGNEVKLVSNVSAAAEKTQPTTGMAEKYAVAPAVTKVQALAQAASPQEMQR